MSRGIVDASIRAFVAKGSGIPIENVIPGLQSAEAPDGLYASVHMINEMPIGRNTGRQVIGSNRSYTIDGVMIESTYSVNFYRKNEETGVDAIEAASRFVDFARSESGINWASTALTDGRIKGANVYSGGQGYTKGDSVVFSPVADTPASDMPTQYATGMLTTANDGSVTRVVMRDLGEGYYDMPVAETTGAGQFARISPRGFGFDIRHPMMVRNLTEQIAGDFEERAQVDLKICHTRVYKDADSGRIEEYVSDDLNIPYKQKGDRLMYIYQTNLTPPGASVVPVQSANREGISIPRVAEWDLTGQNTGADGIGLITLLDTSAIVPQYGRDLIATSPFMTNYEGHIVVTFSGASFGASFSGVFFIRTTHKIPGIPTDIVSTRAFAQQHLSNDPEFPISIALNQFNSMVILDNDIPDGGVIGLKVEFGVGWAGNISDTVVDDLLRQLNTGATITHNPIANLNYSAIGFSTRATFLQFDLA